MNESQKQLYAYLRDNGLTDLSSDKFFSAYSDPSKSKEIHAYLKQNGLTDLDENAFHVAYFSPAKKKSTTGSPSVQPKKPTSSATMPSWMQSSLESSVKKEEKPKKPAGPQVEKNSELNKDLQAEKIASMAGGGTAGISGVGAINAKPKKEEAPDFDVYYGYPGQEKNEYRISNGRWERKYGEKWVEVTNQGSISSLTKFFGKEKEITVDAVFTGFPGKEENKYRISELQNGKKVWEVQRVGQKDYTVISDQGSIDALNRQFDKKIEYTEDAQSKREAQINRRESASEDFKTVTGNLAGKSSDEVAKYLTNMYGDRGFTFQTVDWPKDRIRISAKGTNISETFDLDNWSDNTNSAEALKIRKFLSENQQLGDYIDLEREEKKKAEEIIVGTELTKQDLSNQMARLTGAGSQAEFELAKKKNVEENITKGLNQQSTDVIEARKALIRSDYDTKQRIDDLTRTAKTKNEKQELAAIAYANKDEFVQKHRVDNAYLNDLNQASKAIDGSFKQLNSDVEEFNRYIKDNNITQDQLENDPDLLAQKQELQVRYDQLIADAEDLDFENKKLPFIQNQNARNAALYFAYNETRGSVIGGTWNGFLRGAFGSLQTFRVIDKEGLDALVSTFGSSTTQEFAQSENRNDFSRALLSTSESLGAAAAAFMTGGLAAEGTVASKVLQFIPYFSVSYNEMKNEIDAIPGMNKVPWYKKEALAIAYGVGVGYLDKLSTNFQLKSKISNKIGRDLVLRSIAGLPKGATAEAIEMAIASNFKKDIAAGVIKVVAGSVVEGTTEGVQSAYGSGLKAAYDWMNDVDEFDTREWVSQAFEEAYYGALGGTIMSTPSTLIKGIKNGFGRLDPNDMELARKVIEDSNMRSMVITDIKSKLMSGEITKDQANEQIEAINESMSLFTKIPDDLSAEATSKSMDLIRERSSIEKQIAGKDESLVAPQKARIAEINNELTKISEDATKKSTEQQQEVTAEGGGVQREGVVEGQQEVGQGEGPVGQATEQGADLGNRPVEGRSKEEIDARVSELETMLADDAAVLEETGTGSLMPEAKTEIQTELEALKAEVPLKAKIAVPKIAETTDTKTYSEALSAAKAALKEEGKGLDLQVSDVSQEEADAIVKEGGKIFMTEDGLAGAYVKKDGYMGGLFKNPKATYKEVAKLLQQARIKVGGRFMDAYATELERIYTENGFRPVARLKFNEEYAPEGWDAPGSALASKPDVVFFAYDPEGKYKIGDGEYVTDYDAAYEMAKNFDAKTANEADKLAAILDKKATVSKDVISKEEVSKRVTLAQKALSAILPDVKFVVHDTDESFRKAVGEVNTKDSSAGAYDMVSKTIHVNGTKANKRTVSHEVFHAIVISKASSDAQLQKLTANMVNSVLKSLKQTGTNQDVIEYLEKFAAEYKDDPTVMNEEKLAELHGILGENMIELPLPTQNIIKRFLDRIAKMFGLKEMTDREAVEFMNTMSSKVETGKEITDKEFKVSKTTIKNVIKRFQANFKDEVSGLEFVYDKNGDKFDKLEKGGFITKDKSIVDFNGQYMFFHQPDAAFSGIIVKRNKKTGEIEFLVEGKGGMYYPIKFHEDGYFWASTSSAAIKMAKDLNKAMKKNNGKLLMALTTAPNDKLLSSTTAANAVMDLISSKAFDKNFDINSSQLKNILINAAAATKQTKELVKDSDGNNILDGNGQKQYKIKIHGLATKIKKSDSLEDVKSKIKELLNPSKSSFSDRKTFVESMIKESVDIINSNPKAISQFGEFFSSGIQNKYFKGIRKKGYNISATNMKQALSEMLTEPILKEGVNRTKGGQIYAVIELDGGIDAVNSNLVEAVDSDLHESYPKAIKSINPNNKVTLHILTDRVKWSDVTEDFETNDIVSEDRQSKIYPSAGVSIRALKINTKNIAKEEKVAEVEDKSKTRKQKPLQPDVAEKLTEDGKGNYVFNHYSDKKRDVIKPGTGQNNITSREEGSALSAVGGLAQYYTMDMQKEPGTGPNQHTILIPMERVYYFNKDQEGFYDEAKKRFNKVRPGQAFSPNYQVAFITQVANENGYDMVVANWRNGELRAQTTMELTPSDKIINFKPLKEVTYEVGDTVQIYGDIVKITAIDGDTLTYKNERTSGDFNFKRSPKSIQKVATPKEQVEEEVKSLEEEMKPKMRKQMAAEMQEIKDKSVEDGTFMKAPNGKKTKLDETQWLQVRTKAFKKWFGDWENDPENASKVVDENGEPLVMYHGSNDLDKFNEFKSNKGFDYNFFSSDRNESSRYISDFEQLYPNERYNIKLREEYFNEKIGSFFLNAKNIFDYNKLAYKEKNNVISFLNKNKDFFIKKIEQISNNKNIKSYIDLNDINENISDIDLLKYILEVGTDDWYILETNIFQNFIKENKHDSFTTKESGAYNLALYDNKNIKAADGTNTTFDPNEPNFRRQKPSKQAAVIVKTGKEAGLSDAGIREYMKRNGYTDRQAIDAIQAYNDKKEGIFIDPEWSSLRKAAVLFKRKYFVSRGLLANTVFASNEARLAIIAKQLNIAQKLIVDFDRELEVIRKNSVAQYKKDVRAYINGDPTVDLPAEIKALIDKKTGIKDRVKLTLAINKLAKENVENYRADFDAYIRDKAAVLPLELKKIADSMRAHIDSISRELISNGLIDENLAERVIDNLGSYLNRSYKIYDRKNWKKEIEKEVKQKAINFLKIQLRPIAEEQAKKDNRDVEDTLNDLAKSRVEKYLSQQEEDMTLFSSGGKLGSKNLSTLKAREEIPVEIRMLMGEYTDPGQNYARTILKMSALAANHQFLNEVKKAGTGVFLFDKNDSKTPEGYNYEIAAEGSETMNPLNGMYTSKELKEEFEKQSSQLSEFWKFYMNILSRVKWGKTIMSPATHIKNLLGNIGFVLVNGHWRINEMATAYKAVRDDIFSLDKKQSREYVNRLIELGIIKQSAGMGEIRAMFADASWEESMLSNINKKSGSRWSGIKSGWNKFTKGAEDVYQAEDDFYKIFAYENELSRYSKAMFGKKKKDLTESERAEVDAVVSEIVKNTYPTYSRIPEAVNMIRRAPLIGNFVSFQAESYRTAYMTAQLALKEIKSDNPKIRRIGAQRMTGALMYKSIKLGILSYYSYAAGMGMVGLLGYFTDDEEEKQKEDDVRKFLPEWSVNSDLVVKKASNGVIKYIDMSASDPHGGINKVLNSIMLGETTWDAFINGMGSIVEPFVGEEMTTAAILAIKNNENAYGKPIYNPEDTFYEQSKDITGFMFNVVQPGIVASGRRVAEAESVGEEIIGATTGVRTYEIDVAENFGYQMIKYEDRLLNANRIYTSEVNNDEATEKSIAAAKKRAEKAVTDIHAEIYDLYYSAVRLGADEDKLYDNLKSFGGMTKRTISYMFGQEEFYIKNKYPEEEE
jgi:hypothetical protein